VRGIKEQGGAESTLWMLHAVFANRRMDQALLKVLSGSEATVDTRISDRNKDSVRVCRDRHGTNRG